MTGHESSDTHTSTPATAAFPTGASNADIASGVITEASRAPWRTIAWAGPLAALALILGPVLIAWGSLPDRIAMSWRDGEATNVREPQALLALLVMFAIVCVALFVLGGTRRLRGDSFNAGAVLVATAMTAIFAVQSVMTVVANSGEASGAGVPEPGFLWTIAAMVAPLLALVGVGALFRHALVATPPTLEAAPSAGLDLAEAEAAAWYSDATAAWAGALTVVAWTIPVVLLVGVFFVGPAFLIGLLVALPVVIAITSFSRIAVAVDRRGLTVRYGLLPWPRTNISLDKIVSATAANVRPGEQGGWGYRGSRALLGKAAVVVRAGEGMHLKLVNDREFTVTVDNAAQGAGVLNDLLNATRGVAAQT